MAASLQVEQKDMPLLKSLEITRAQQVIAFIPTCFSRCNE